MASSRKSHQLSDGRGSPAPSSPAGVPSPLRTINVTGAGGSSSLPMFSHGRPQGGRIFRRTLLTALTVTLSLLLLSLLYYRPTSSHSYSRHAHLTSSSSSPFTFTSSRPKCDPYHLYGHLNVDPLIPENNRYHPFDTSCKAPELFRGMRDKLGKSSDEAKKMGYPGWGKKGEDVEWVRGRTVLMIGDSTVREQLVQFCDHIGQTPTILSASGTAPHTLLEKRGGRSASLPRTCYSPELDFLLVSVFHFGADEEDYWKDKDQYNPPGLFETRMKELILPLTKDLDLLVPKEARSVEGKSRRVDLVEVSTGLWDLARFATIDVANKRSTITDLNAEQLHWFRGRIEKIVKSTVKAFPGVKVVWRSMHYPSDKNAKLDWFMGWNWDNDAVHRPFFHHNRILQLDQASRSAIIPQGSSPGIPEVEFSEWGNILLGQHAHQADQLHPGPLPAGWLGSDMMLFELREAVFAEREHDASS
ncbi:hypothetical protein BDY24DRAFT_401115 [Mrakia frigida]|uniref:uncharacterized protein n=1 Tax=Mrakia frigida TaxID=29902 RepID=UPI003FCBFF91